MEYFIVVEVNVVRTFMQKNNFHIYYAVHYSARVKRQMTDVYCLYLHAAANPKRYAAYINHIEKGFT